MSSETVAGGVKDKSLARRVRNTPGTGREVEYGKVPLDWNEEGSPTTEPGSRAATAS